MLLPQPLCLRLALLLCVQRLFVPWFNPGRPLLRPIGKLFRGDERVSGSQRRAAVAELRRLVPAPPLKQLGGEACTDHAYCRFLSACSWEPAKAAPMLSENYRWRIKYRPRKLRPTDMPNACRQRAWKVIMAQADEDEPDDACRSLHPPHNKPPLRQWRLTRSGMPVTLINTSHWYPEHYKDRTERVRHVAYHLEHYIRRMPMRQVRSTAPHETCCR
jgi:hypothetical protein